MSTHYADGASFQPGESWPEPEDPCVTHKCEQLQDVFTVVTMKKECPKINCPPVSLGFPTPAEKAAHLEMRGRPEWPSGLSPPWRVIPTTLHIWPHEPFLHFRTLRCPWHSQWSVVGTGPRSAERRWLLL